MKFLKPYEQISIIEFHLEILVFWCKPRSHLRPSELCEHLRTFSGPQTPFGPHVYACPLSCKHLSLACTTPLVSNPDYATAIGCSYCAPTTSLNFFFSSYATFISYRKVGGGAAPTPLPKSGWAQCPSPPASCIYASINESRRNYFKIRDYLHVPLTEGGL